MRVNGLSHFVMLRSAILWVALTILSGGCQRDTTGEASSISDAASGLRLNTILGESNSETFVRAETPRTFRFPEDHGPHNAYRSEWWYLTAALEDETGNAYGVHYTLFRQALAPQPTGEGPWHTAQAYLGHLAVTDVSNADHFEAERFARGHPELAGVSTGKQFRAHIEDWTLSGSAEDKLNLSLSADAVAKIQKDRFGVQLQLEQTGPIVLQGHRGLSEKGPGSASYYYSIPRLQLTGTLELNGRSVPVKGLGWLDREWSTSVLGENLSGWDWFSLQLDDERSIMAFRLRRNDGERDAYDHGLVVDHPALDGESLVGKGDPGIKVLAPDDFTLKPTEYYRDSKGVQWPVSWILTMGDESLTIKALLDAQTVDLSIRYWEGIVEVLNPAGTRLGRGYMELTGYRNGDSLPIN